MNDDSLIENQQPRSEDALLKKLPLHGGDIQGAAQRYGIALEQWVDLSTGMNPEAYPVPPIPASAFNDLPYWQTDFLKAASAYYQQENFLAVAGTQSAIQHLPAILNANQQFDVLLPDVGYQEHAKQWHTHSKGQNNCKLRSKGDVKALSHYRSDTLIHMCEDINASIRRNAAQHIVVIRPNNPTTVLVDTQQLLDWAQQLTSGAYLIVDEAFIDVDAEQSLLALKNLPSNIIVLRSFGKFFGLAGIRLGFVFANEHILASLNEKIGIWPVNGPAQYIAACALADREWHRQAKLDIAKNSSTTLDLFKPLLTRFALVEPLRHALFLSLPMSLSLALRIYDFLAKGAVLTRVVVLENDRALLRVGCVNHLNTQAVTNIKKRIHQLCMLEHLDEVPGSLTSLPLETIIE